MSDVRAVHDSSVRWEVAWVKPGARFVIATDVPLTEVRQFIASIDWNPSLPGLPGRSPALMVSRMDEVAYKSDRAAARKGKRKHPVEREWQRVCKEVSAAQKKERLEEGRRTKARRVDSTVDSNIKAYLERHRDG